MTLRECVRRIAGQVTSSGANAEPTIAMRCWSCWPVMR